MTLVGEYLIINKLSGLGLEVLNSGPVDGAEIVQKPPTGDGHQLWKFSAVGDGHFELISVATSGCLDDGRSSTVNGGLLHHWSRHGGENQRWKLKRNANGYYHIISHVGGLAVDGRAETHEGAGIHLWELHKGDTQQWKLVPKNKLEFYLEQQRNRREELQGQTRDLAKISLPSEIVRNIDLRVVAQRMASLVKDLKKISDFRKNRDQAGFFKKFWWAVTGETTDKLVGSLDTQSELLGMVSVLMTLHTMHSKELIYQQDTIRDQQDDIVMQNEIISEHQSQIEEQNQRLIAINESVLKLTKDEKKLVLDVVEHAKSLESLKAQFDKNIPALNELVRSLEVSLSGEKAERYSQDTNISNELAELGRNQTEALNSFREFVSRRYVWMATVVGITVAGLILHILL